MINNLKIIKSVDGDYKGTFVIEPLPRTYGSTIANSLRRVLLTSIKGAAATQLNIEGANHQFTTLKGVKEDIVQITLNLKNIRFSVHTDGPVVITLNKKGKGEVTAKDFNLSSDVEIMNPDQLVATLSDDNSEINMEVIVESGMGYSPREDREKSNSKLGSITLDALFSPIKNATYKIESTRFGDRVDLDKIVLDVETDGSVTPADAVRQAAEVLKSYYEVIGSGDSELTKKEAEEIANEPTVSTVKKEIANVSIEELPLQTRTINALKKHGIETLKELATKTDEELADVKNLGEKSLNEIKDLLKKETEQ